MYSSITGAFWQICHERQKGFPLSSKCGKMGSGGEVMKKDWEINDLRRLFQT
jgi:hypothetical protein